jgi:hypothetical protein
MPLEVSEYEMIERFSDSLKKSAARAGEFLRTPLEKQPTLFVDFIEGLKTAAGSAHQLAHAQENPNFLRIRDTLEAIIGIGQTLPTFNRAQSGKWFEIKLAIEGIELQGSKMARQKAMKRQDVLAELVLRDLAERRKNDKH